MTTVLDYALAYAARGMPVLPLRPRDKEARQPGRFCTCTGDDSKSLIGTTDPRVIGSWDPRANVGVITGQRSGLLVLDVDAKYDGQTHLASWYRDREAEGRVIPPHPWVITPTGGRHHWFAIHDHVKTVTGWLRGVDVKACGGYVAAPPSVRDIRFTYEEDGFLVDDEVARRYEWGHVGVVPVPDAPEWLLEDVGTRRETDWGGGTLRGGKLPTTQELKQHGLPHGRRNEWMFKLACRLWTKHGDLESKVMIEAFEVWEATVDREDFTWNEALGCIQSARDRMRRAREADARLVGEYLGEGTP